MAVGSTQKERKAAFRRVGYSVVHHTHGDPPSPAPTPAATPASVSSSPMPLRLPCAQHRSPSSPPNECVRQCGSEQGRRGGGEGKGRERRRRGGGRGEGKGSALVKTGSSLFDHFPAHFTGTVQSCASHHLSHTHHAPHHTSHLTHTLHCMHMHPHPSTCLGCRLGPPPLRGVGPDRHTLCHP